MHLIPILSQHQCILTTSTCSSNGRTNRYQHILFLQHRLWLQALCQALHLALPQCLAAHQDLLLTQRWFRKNPGACAPDNPFDATKKAKAATA